MGEKISHEAVLPISLHFFTQQRPTIYVPDGMDIGTNAGKDAFAAYCADEFVKFHRAFYTRLKERLESDK